ncbi:TPA: restriction endonuclease subunit S [Staphylococcus aureus]|uniref:restriction endonuclease subunit S n=1 Tax=Staphylococcus epidermidis TaxID=1282 RepID=UPI0011579756|nr:restriction endonuclease subunit S [Staphylococcus epidermidis]HDE8545557.1 restriction endonuclease subunit S [Staphylococcus aureus]HDF0387569.1 restriction endonuclease subunit S [Staphylococcus aureus]
MSEQINTPKMRFPEFRDEWEMKIIKELFNVVSGSTPLRSNTSYYENGNIPWVKTTDLNNSLINNTSEKVTDIALNNLKLLPKDTVLIAMYGGFNQIGRTGILNIKATTNQAISALIKKDDYNSKFLQSYLNFNVKQWRRFAASSRKDPNITKRDIEKFKIPYTCLEEQEKIGGFFSKIDRQIELEEKKLDLLEQQKRGYMQKIFSQELRFKDENGNKYPNWQTVKIGSILKERKERSGDGEMLSVTINHGIVKFDEIDRKDNSSKDKSNYKKVYKNDIAYNSMRMWQGASGKAEFDGIVSPAYTVVTPIENINSNFIAYYFKTHNMIHKFRINSQGLTSDTWNLKYKQLKDIKISICSKEEQDKIADLLTILDTRIKKQNHKLEILNINKKGLLQKMFV